MVGKNPDSGMRKPNDSTNRRSNRDPRVGAEKKDNEDSGLRINESGQIRDSKESDAETRANFQQQRQRDIQMQRRSNETESRSLQQKNWGTTSYWRGSESLTHIRHESAQSSEYPVRPGERDCAHYLRTGLCGYGSNCRFNHPPTHFSPEATERIAPQCKFFLRGYCKFGSSCPFTHSKRNVGSESSSMAEKRARTTQERDPEERVQGVNDDIEQGEGNVGLQSVEAQETNDDIEEGEANVELDNIEEDIVPGYERVRFEQGEENLGLQLQLIGALEERTLTTQEMRDHELEKRQRDIQRQRREEKLKLDQMKATVEFSDGSGPKEDMQQQIMKIEEKQRRRDIENQKRESRLKLEQMQEEQRRRDIENQRRESRLKIEQMRSTVQFDEGSQVREALPELGFQKKEGDGF
ncbi:unnamed protein product [Thlaspi arvense]|uniref:C3H1-type domain-containing protein n=1 Tax=Thlaspi arvense TaxID=13288 RepID=A0AAU9R9A2_THLAR|nr:unnamed protein product [Thlaspi arvense]